MNYFDDENKIIEMFQETEDSEIYFPFESDSAICALNAIKHKTNWMKWKNSSGKNDPPPDFYSDKLKLMMEVMRVDDHSYIDESGRVINPTNARESQVQKEIRDKYARNGITFKGDIIVNAYPGLSTLQDHNYTFYHEGFARVLNHHKSKIELYRKNHPGYQLIFFVLDESSAYAKSLKPINELTIEYLATFQGDPHLFFLDKRFVDVIMPLDIDYLIWFAPFKLINAVGDSVVLPRAVVYDIKHYIPQNLITYSKDHIISCEL